MKIFWSWQNDVQPQSNRQFIRGALIEAIARVSDELGLVDADRAEIDHDTKGAAGAADIAETIFGKITEAAVFVADVTPVGSTGTKALPNPNVMIELGWALSATGYKRVITVLNLASGYKPDDLPFDIRQRRTLTYELADSAPKASRKRQKSKLVESLAGALMVNLQATLQNQPSDAAITAIPNAQGDPSIWASMSNPLEFRGGLGGTNEKVLVPEGARAFLRVIPHRWKSGIPAVTSHEHLRDSDKIWPPSEGSSSGSFGVCDDGYVRLWYGADTDAGERTAPNVAMWFDETGEFWILHGTALFDWKQLPTLSTASVFRNWREQLSRIHRYLDHHGASRTRRVELGLVGIKGAIWPSQSLYAAPRSRKPQIILDATQNWSDEKSDEFLLQYFNKLRDGFGMPHGSMSDLQSVFSAR